MRLLENSNPPEFQATKHFAQSIYFAGTWCCGIFGPFHLFTRTRFYFEGFQTIDFISLIGAFFGSVLIVFLSRNHPIRTTTIGFIGMAIIGYWSMLTVPIQTYANTTIIIEIGNISTLVGAINYSLTVFCAGLIIGSATQIWMYESIAIPETGRSRQIWDLEMIFGIAVGLIIYLVMIYATPMNSNNSFVIMAFISSLMVLFLAFKYPLIRKTWTSPLISEFNRMKSLQRITDIQRFFSFFLTFIVTAAFIILPIFIYFHLLATTSETQEIIFFISNLLGASGILCVIYIKKFISRILRYCYIFIVAIILRATIVAEFDSGAYSPINLGMGLVACLMSFYYLREISFYSRAKTGGIWVLLIWLSTAYLTGIPSKNSELMAISSFVPTILLLGIYIEIFAQLLRYMCVPDIFQRLKYLETLKFIEADKNQRTEGSNQ